MGLLCLIGFCSASLLPETEDKPEAAPVEDTDTTQQVTVADTLQEVVTAKDKPIVVEQEADSLQADSLETGLEEAPDTMVAPHTEPTTTVKHEIEQQHEEKQHEPHNKDKADTESHDKTKDNLME